MAIHATKLLYNNAYYQLQAVLNSKKYAKMKKDFINELAAKGVTLPSKGIARAPDRLAFSKELRRTDINFNVFVDRVLKEFNVQQFTSEIGNGIKHNLFYTSSHHHISLENDVTFRNQEFKEYFEVSFRVFPWTIKEDVIENLWEYITYHKKSVGWSDNRGRNRVKKTFVRDFKVYELFLQQSKICKKGESPYAKVIASVEFAKLMQEYDTGSSYDEALGFIVSNQKKLLKNLNIV